MTSIEDILTLPDDMVTLPNVMVPSLSADDDVAMDPVGEMFHGEGTLFSMWEDIDKDLEELRSISIAAEAQREKRNETIGAPTDGLDFDQLFDLPGCTIAAHDRNASVPKPGMGLLGCGCGGLVTPRTSTHRFLCPCSSITSTDQPLPPTSTFHALRVLPIKTRSATVHSSIGVGQGSSGGPPWQAGCRGGGTRGHPGGRGPDCGSEREREQIPWCGSGGSGGCGRDSSPERRRDVEPSSSRGWDASEPQHGVEE
ncbi:hypothetical protein BDK51DRAFT_52258 [Blyttiomyces helicus]|uniref:Uncharacterized protein n=1 Tax=Blyttiomyces helicus TaxID=388810 RepID=A0A4V1IRH1_9FUNG|nr:hypothetical protein BDK51DRAFT_52258 [Blyttiomyces helicus]|eukprot:RKO90037.1 hypothetical protein BDK51DRAFT_52258 [Blyttiomyces helicus]